MDAYVTEEQQVEAIKKWFNRYGNMISWAIIIILATMLSVKYWFHHQEVLSEQASDVYGTLLQAFENKEEPTIKAQANKLREDYPRSAYATFSALVLADEAVLHNDTAKGIESLTWAMEQGKQADFRALARVRLMRLYVAENKLTEALALYDEGQAGPYRPIMLELKGDILRKQQDYAGARQAYEEALLAAPKEQMIGFLLKLKLEELGVDPEALNDQKTKATK